MNFKIKSASLIAALFMIVGSFVLFVSESEAQDAEIKTYKIGDIGPAGGWIFYDKGNSSDGWRYLEAAPEDQAEGVKWGCSGESIPGARGIAIGTGKINTQAIIKSCSKDKIAAKKCTEYRGGGKSDWFLPSKDELNLLFENLYKNGIGGFAEEYYWSSSEEDGYPAPGWLQDFSFGGQNDYAKDTICKVRAVRAF